MASNYIELPLQAGSGSTLLASNNVWTGTNEFMSDVTVGADFTILPLGTATNSVNYSSNPFTLESSYWTGSSAAIDDWVWQTVLGAGANPYSIMNLAHAGSPGLATVYMPALDNTPIGLINPSPASFSTVTMTGLLNVKVQGAGVTPTGAVAGSVAFTSAFVLAVYNGSAWKRASDGTTAVTF